MKNQLEVEYIGTLSLDYFKELKSKMNRIGSFKKKKDRITFMYFKDKVPKNLSEIKDEDIDLRLRVTNRNPEIIIKKGLFTGSHSRKEISIEFKKNEIQKYIDFLSAMNWRLGVIYAVQTFVYEYKGVEISLVDIKDYGYNFEAEILTNKEEELNARKKINIILKELNLNPFTEKELDIQCNAINNREELRFNFSKDNIEDFKKRFNDFF